MDTFGAWLRQQRAQRHLTREQLAERVGCSVALLRKIEDDERHPSTQIAELLANALTIPATDRATFVKVARGELRVDRLPPSAWVNPAATVPPASAPPRSNLPVLPTPLIGRQREVTELSQLLGDAQCRLLTLVGPGGIGKTRLAIETATQIQERFSDGVYFVALAPVNTTRLLVPVIADAVGFAFPGAGSADPKSQLLRYLQAKQMLLLMDNLEQLLAEPGIEVLTELLAHAPQVKLLATSRETVGVQEEWVFEVQGLPIPTSNDAVAGAPHTSVELFLQRARRAYVRFNATPADYPAIVRICQLVEGMPLGIELAAAWVRTLTCDEIAQEIAHGLDFLQVAARDRPARHHSLRAVFDHSWRLLSAEEQGVLRRLALFRGGFRREAAEAVAGARLTTLAALVTKSFIRRNGASRYELHELIRQFAAEQLAHQAEEARATQARHGQYYLTFFSRAEGRFRSSAQRETIAELTAEMDNFRAAWEWAVAQGEFALIEQTMRLLKWFYDMRGWFQEGREALGRTIAALEMALAHAPTDRINQVALGHLLAAHAWLDYRLAHYAPAQAMLERSLAILRPLHEPRVLIEAITFLGMLMEVTGNYASALALYGEGAELATVIDDRWYTALSQTCLHGLTANTSGTANPAQTHACLQSAVADWRAIGDPRFTAFGLRILSQSAVRLGWYAEARAALEESAAVNSSLGDRWGVASAYRGLGVVAQRLGEHGPAVAMFRQSLEIFTELGGSWWVARVLAELAQSVFALGHDAEAASAWCASLRIATETHSPPVILEALVGLASLQAKRDNLEDALELLLIALQHPASDQETRNQAAARQPAVAAQLTPQQVAAIQMRVQAKSLATVLDEALRQGELV